MALQRLWTQVYSSLDEIPLNYKACQAIASWLKIRPDVDHDNVFVSKFQTPMVPRTIQYTVKKYMKDARIYGASVHTLES